MRFAICNEVFEGWDWESTCRFVARVGYDGIELAPFTLVEDVRSTDETVRSRLRRTAQDAGLEITGLHWLLVSPEGLSLTTPDEAIRRETANYLTALVHFCADLGGSVMTLGSPKQRRVHENDSRDAAVERFVTALRPALDVARERGVVVCLEPLPPPEANFLLTLAEVVEVLDALNHPAAKTIFDVKSASWEQQPLPGLIARYAPYLAHSHANDTNLRGPGFGNTDFRPILKALQSVAYEGYVSVEPFDYNPDPETVATKSLDYLKSCLEDDETNASR